jgi:hypothetical protein
MLGAVTVYRVNGTGESRSRCTLNRVRKESLPVDNAMLHKENNHGNRREHEKEHQTATPRGQRL